MRTQEIERKFPGIVINGGGVWPWPEECPAQKASVVFLVGDRNPLHKNGLVLRDHYQRCGNDLTFHLLRGAEHDGEWKALSEKGGVILEALATARLTRPASSAIATSAMPSASQSTTPPVAPPAVQPIQPRAGCGCDAAGAMPGAPLVAMLPALVLLGRRRRGR